MSITLDPSQLQAAEKFKEWFLKESKEPRFVLAGLAGTGKTTIINYILSDLEIQPNEVAFCAYTGKAALVMRRKGCPASTIHSLIYDVVVEENEDGEEELSFKRKDRLPKQLKLIVVDEASMVAKEMQEDLESYGIPVLYAGDHGQLPPVGDSFATLMLYPDVRLEQIHRQAEGNPIIRAAMMARGKQMIPSGLMKNEQGSFMKVPKRFLTHEQLMSFDQILCGKNVTRQGLNNTMRELLGRTTTTPQKGDRVICLKNNNNIGLVNGMQGFIEHCEPITLRSGRLGYLAVFQDEEGRNYQGKENKEAFYATWKDSEGNKIRKPALRIQPQIFEGGKPDLLDGTLAPFDYSYAITVHKSQGSQYDRILIMEEFLGDRDNHAKWLYTAITRGIQEVILATAK